VADGQSKVGDWAVMKRIFQQGWRYRWMILLATVGAAATGALLGSLLFQMTSLITMIGKAAGTGASFSDFFSSRNPTHQVASEEVARIGAGMTALGWRLLALAPLAAAGSYIAWYAGQWVANRCMMDLRNRMLDHLTRLDLAFHGELSRGDLLTRLTTDLENMLTLQQTLYGKLLQRPVEGLAWVGVMFVMCWPLAAVAVVVVTFAMFLIAPVLRRTRSRSQHARQRLAENFSVLEQVTAGIRVIKAMGSSQREQERYAQHNRTLFDANMRMTRARAQSDAMTYGGVFAIGALGMLGAGWLYQAQGIEPIQLILFLTAMGRLITVMRETQRGWGDAQERIPAAERVYAVLDRPSRIVDRTGALPCPAPSKAITVESVRFRYLPQAEEVLRGIDLEIAVGKTVALVGESGSGKSTLLDLIPRFHDVGAGRIAFDGIDIRDYQVESLVRHVAIVQQDSFLFNDTVYSNIAYGRPGATREEVEQAARRAHVHEAILALEGGKGYDTVVGDRGGRLSGGQRQRVAIARALLRDAPILLLDEPTSALDADSEQHVQEALQELMLGRTTVVVAHRLATIQRADLIYVLAGKDDPRRGTVLESGTHRELIERGGEYARLVKLQQLTI
jgi:subfamily B ATP-binding cassette protein MsbA